jgi:hypothetical protein
VQSASLGPQIIVRQVSRIKLFQNRKSCSQNRYNGMGIQIRCIELGWGESRRTTFEAMEVVTEVSGG